MITECRRCGTVFKSYRQTTGPRVYCSLRCANKESVVGETIQSRMRFEFDAGRDLLLDGWDVSRSVGSRGPYDLVATRGDELRLIQVKSTARPSGTSAVRMCAKAVEDLLRLNCPSFVGRWLYVWIFGQGWKKVRVDDWRDERRVLLRRVATEIFGAS